jgi:transglutaminase-like putative cysteine protease
MKLSISHRTDYTYKKPPQYGLQRIRLRPQTGPGQTVVDWSMALEGAVLETEFTDHHGNHTALTSLIEGSDAFSISVSGVVETQALDGVLGMHRDYIPLWYFNRVTDLTSPGPRIDEMLAKLGNDFADDVSLLHAVSHRIAEVVAYKAGQTDATTTSEAAMGVGAGVCQDHAHIFLSAARKLGYPARYVSGYLMMDDRVMQDATHAWAEAHLNGLGWVGFDISNGISPDERYVRVATGLDYRDAAPIAGMRFGEDDETMSVSVQVQQQ